MPITLNGDTGIQTPMYNGTITANAVTPSVNMKNRIINGAMVIDQRNAGASVTTNNNAGYGLDRWNFRGTYTTARTFSYVKDTTVFPTGFSSSVKITVVTSGSPAAGDAFLFNQSIEGFNVADLDYGLATAKTLTLSFWVRSSVAGTYGLELVSFNSSGNITRAYGSSYVINSPNTWEQKSIIITGDTTQALQTDNKAALSVLFDLGSGSSRIAPTSNVWGSSGDSQSPAVAGGVALIANAGATFYITGVQLEVGSTATSFDYRPYGTELALCQRYFYLLGKTSTYSTMGIAIGADTTESLYISPLPVTMRATPSYSTAGNLRIYNGATRAITSSSINAHATPNIPSTTFIASGGGLAAGQGLNISANNDVTAYIAFSAEL